MTVATIEELDALVAQVKAAQQRFAEFSQEQVDVIFRAAALAAADARIPLARMAVEETGMGVLEDKVIKNHFASEYIYNAYQTAFSQYDRPQARHRYGEIAQHLGLPGRNTAERIGSLLAWLEELKGILGIPPSIRAAGVDEAGFMARLDLIAEGAFDDQCTGSNPRFPLISELRQILLDSYHGRPYDVGAFMG
jgi:hypothetical protein